jgi:hypothetical protein
MYPGGNGPTEGDQIHIYRKNIYDIQVSDVPPVFSSFFSAFLSTLHIPGQYSNFTYIHILSLVRLGECGRTYTHNLQVTCCNLTSKVKSDYLQKGKMQTESRNIAFVIHVTYFTSKYIIGRWIPLNVTYSCLDLKVINTLIDSKRKLFSNNFKWNHLVILHRWRFINTREIIRN